jgi:hypothetical protein
MERVSAHFSTVDACGKNGLHGSNMARCAGRWLVRS